MQDEVAAARRAEQVAAEEVAIQELKLSSLASLHEQSRQQAEAQRRKLVVQLQATAAIARQVESGETQLAAAHQAIAQLGSLAAISANATSASTY